VGPLAQIGLPTSFGNPVNAIDNADDRRSKEYDELEFKDDKLDNIKMPVIQINIQNLQLNLLNNLMPKPEEKKELQGSSA
jgi:hypothetical protein